MRKPDRRRGGFTLIEVIAATVLLVVTAAGFMMMTAVNAKLLAKEHRYQRSGYELGALAGTGEGEATGETLTVEFAPAEGGDEGAEEIFEQYSVSEGWEDVENSMTFYKYRQR